MGRMRRNNNAEEKEPRKRGKPWKEREMKQFDEVLNVSPSMLSISK